ncbi:MAG: energy-coupling factor transporter transmembrane protein EcfT [Ardenticatenaceae bacterium]|nr:energy-coupling factor transporter transmembrane protein EcfT [Ardenticatenaceae bacterium]
MSVNINLYTPRPSWVHRTDPRVKLLFVGVSLFLLVLYKNLWFMLAALGLVHLLHWQAQMPRERFGFIWKTLLPISVLMLLLRVIFYPIGEPIFEFWFIRITLTAVAQGLVLAGRLVTMAFVVFAWLYTTEQPLLIQSLVKLKVPYSWALTLALALRYIPTFQATYTMIWEAQQARGLDLGETKGLQRVRRMMPIFVAMIITALRSSSQLAMAIEARAFGVAGVRRSYWHDLQARPFDYFLTFLLLTLLAGLTYVYFGLGWGSQPF